MYCTPACTVFGFLDTPSIIQERAQAYSRCQSAGRSTLGKLLCKTRLSLSAVSLWLLVVLLRLDEHRRLGAWLNKPTQNPVCK